MSKEMLVFGIIIPLYVIVLFISSIWAFKHENKITKEIAEVKKLADNANTLEELDEAWIALVKVNEKCWHVSRTTSIVRIRTIIETKDKMLCQNKKS